MEAVKRGRGRPRKQSVTFGELDACAPEGTVPGEPELEERELRIPIMSEPGPGYTGNSGPFQLYMSRAEQVTLTCILQALQATGATLTHETGPHAGKPVASRQDALRWLVQQAGG